MDRVIIVGIPSENTEIVKLLFTCIKNSIFDYYFFYCKKVVLNLRAVLTYYGARGKVI